MLQLSIDPDQSTPLVEQIVDAIRHQGRPSLRPGMRLPPIRRLAQMQQVSRFTVEAYDRLVAMGYLGYSRRGSGLCRAARRSAQRKTSRGARPRGRRRLADASGAR